ncbi:SixA phosphatase family protein [Nakamurella sp.]|uniref:SixA phosphatase family protein n=1 Tax=Nakamurella sp. TaxID=1869182 RepID=UPI003B3BD7D7
MPDQDLPIAGPARTLVLMRHAEAGGAARDHDRPLTPAGVRAAAAVGDWMRATLPPVDLTICSTSTRTRQTRDAVAVGGEVRYSDELYGGGVDDILDQIATAPDAARTLLVVGHAPTVPSTAWELVTQAAPDGAREPGAGDDLRRFAPGSVAVLTTTAGWDRLGEFGAALRTVRHPTA